MSKREATRESARHVYSQAYVPRSSRVYNILLDRFIERFILIHVIAYHLRFAFIPLLSPYLASLLPRNKLFTQLTSWRPHRRASTRDTTECKTRATTQGSFAFTATRNTRTIQTIHTATRLIMPSAVRKARTSSRVAQRCSISRSEARARQTPLSTAATVDVAPIHCTSPR